MVGSSQAVEARPGPAPRVLRGVDGAPWTVRAVRHRAAAPTYNLSVAETATYFVGDEGVLAHNTSPCPRDRPGPLRRLRQSPLARRIANVCWGAATAACTTFFPATENPAGDIVLTTPGSWGQRPDSATPTDIISTIADARALKKGMEEAIGPGPRDLQVWRPPPGARNAIMPFRRRRWNNIVPFHRPPNAPVPARRGPTPWAGGAAAQP